MQPDIKKTERAKIILSPKRNHEIMHTVKTMKVSNKKKITKIFI